MSVATPTRLSCLSRLLRGCCHADAAAARSLDLGMKSMSTFTKPISTVTKPNSPSVPSSHIVNDPQMRLMSSQTALAKDQVEGSGKAELISKAMRSYIDRARTHGRFMEKQCAEFDIGKRHLARIMGKDPTVDFHQADIDKAIEYLFPSGLFSPAARPFMRHPSKVFPKRKSPQFGWDGRPFHPLFYTGKPQFNRVLHDGRILLEKVAEAATVARVKSSRKQAEDEDTKEESDAARMSVYLSSSKWISKEEFNAKLIEKLHSRDYDRFVNLGDRILEHSSTSHLARTFLSEYRESIGDLVRQREIREALVNKETGVRYAIGVGSRKCSKAEVILREGTGKIVINGNLDGVDFFDSFLERAQLLTPLAFLGRIEDFDIEAEVQGPDNAFVSRASAIRIGICRALTAFCTPTEVENMRLAGLLTEDPRVRERKLPGQKGARAKFRWNRR